MTQEDKQLLLKDLCGRLPHHVRCKVWLKDGTTEEGPLDLQHNYGDVLRDAFYYNKIKDIKPYLRPISSMTEKEFFKQVWRAYDTVELENGIKGRVMNVCFSTRSVRVIMPDGNPEWFRFNFVKEHISVMAEPDDASIIESLHNKLMDADNKINWLQEEKKRLEEKLSNNHIDEILKNLNVLLTTIDGKKKRVEKVEKCIENLDTIISKLENDGKGQ